VVELGLAGAQTLVANIGGAFVAGVVSSAPFSAVLTRKHHPMCGIVGGISKAPVNQVIYDALLLLQHRGQDAAGIVTMLGTKCFMHKARGMVRDVFRTRNMRSLLGQVGLGQVRYPTAGNAYSEEEAQPFYVNAPYGIVLVHNGNLTNAHALKAELFEVDRRHINTESDTEVLINVLAHELEQVARDLPLTPDHVFRAVGAVHKRVKGSYAGPWPAGLSRPVWHSPTLFWPRPR
jgi:amidophosphoribosyltransferase